MSYVTWSCCFSEPSVLSAAWHNTTQHSMRWHDRLRSRTGRDCLAPVDIPRTTGYSTIARAATYSRLPRTPVFQPEREREGVISDAQCCYGRARPRHRKQSRVGVMFWFCVRICVCFVLGFGMWSFKKRLDYPVKPQDCETIRLRIFLDRWWNQPTRCVIKNYKCRYFDRLP